MTSSAPATGFRLALGTFTILPVGTLPQLTRRHAHLAMLLAPVAALPVAVGVAFVVWTASLLHVPAVAAGLLGVGAGAYLTRGMHVDGLADTVDGFAAGWTRERALTVMKSGDVGPMGVVALLVNCGVQAALLGHLAAHPWLLIGAWTLARTSVAWVASTLDAARPDGLGALMARTVPMWQALAVTGLAGLALGVVTWVSGLAWWKAPVMVTLAATVLTLLIHRTRRILGGSNGDIFGAAIELTTTALLLGAVWGA